MGPLCAEGTSAASQYRSKPRRRMTVRGMVCFPGIWRTAAAEENKNGLGQQQSMTNKDYQW